MKLVVSGIVKNTDKWIAISEVAAVDGASKEEAEIIAEQIRDSIYNAYPVENKSMPFTFGKVVIDVKAFAAIEVVISE